MLNMNAVFLIHCYDFMISSNNFKVYWIFETKLVRHPLTPSKKTPRVAHIYLQKPPWVS